MKLQCALIWLAAGTCFSSRAHGQVYGPPDRMVITHAMSTSSMQLKDMNNDQAVSDVDVSMMVLNRLVEIYGEDLDVGDVDLNGVVNGEDMVAAIAKIVRASFGKTAADSEPVGMQDVMATASGVTTQAPGSDVNFDGNANVQDVLVSYENLGTDVNEQNVIDNVSRELFSYIGAIRTLGSEHFMATAAAPNTHMEGVSNTWPAEHPDWWRPNHLVAISRLYDPPNPPRPPDHSAYRSSQDPPAPHGTAQSRQWPPNHRWESSTTWPPPPPGHTTLVSYQPGPHATAISSLWPPSHTSSVSSTWGPTHEVTVSRTWWPMHTAADSFLRTWPPLHEESITSTWIHQVALSRSTWPPNHTTTISNGWGPNHQMGISANYPPGHLLYASQSWPGPQPWPPGHTQQVSQSWGETPQPWPIFPNGHDWFTTFTTAFPNITPRFPWSMGE